MRQWIDEELQSIRSSRSFYYKNVHKNVLRRAAAMWARSWLIQIKNESALHETIRELKYICNLETFAFDAVSSVT